MKELVVILDPAHGFNVAGKCSPDGTHREYRWSRERIRNIKELLLLRDFEVLETTMSENEPGLSVRKNFATNVRPGSRKLLLSLHNNAAGADCEWHSAQGASVYTTPGITDSDRCAKILLDRFEKDFPEVRIRRYNVGELDGDFEERFTVLMGSGYMACLVEWLFQDNREDLVKLKSAEFNRRFEVSIVEAIEEINNYFKK